MIRRHAALIITAILLAGCLTEPVFTDKPDMVTDTTLLTPDMKGGDDASLTPDMKKADTGPVCNTGHPFQNSCVDCIDDTHCGTKLCNTTSHTCVDCIENTTCTTPDASKCDTNNTNTCIACTHNDDCAHLTDTPRCETGICKVECKKETDCENGNICNLAPNHQDYQTCVPAPAKKASQCQPCVADAECKEGYHCIPMLFKGNPHGNYCLETEAHVKGCKQPWQTKISRVSLDGAAAVSHCGLAESKTTCEAVVL